jgi:hypothetical protein
VHGASAAYLSGRSLAGRAITEVFEAWGAPQIYQSIDQLSWRRFLKWHLGLTGAFYTEPGEDGNRGIKPRGQAYARVTESALSGLGNVRDLSGCAV